MKKFQNPEDLRSFLLAASKGNVAKICEEFAMSRATYYRAVDWIIERCDLARRLEEERGAQEPNAQSELVKQVREVSLANPAWGPVLIAKELSRSESVSSTTVHKILTSLGWATRQERLGLLTQKIISGELVDPTPVHWQAAAKANPSITDIPRLKNPENMAIGAALIPLAGVLDGRWKLLLFVDLGSLFTFGRLIRNTRDQSLHLRLKCDTQDDLQMLMTIAGSKSCSIYHYFSADFIQRLGGEVVGSKQQRQFHAHFCKRSYGGSTRMLEMRVKSELLAPLALQPIPACVDEIRGNLLAWLIEHNASQSGDVFPTFGKSPAEMLGVDGNEVRRFLTKVTSAYERPSWKALDSWLNKRHKSPGDFVIADSDS